MLIQAESVEQFEKIKSKVELLGVEESSVELARSAMFDSEIVIVEMKKILSNKNIVFVTDLKIIEISFAYDSEIRLFFEKNITVLVDKETFKNSLRLLQKVVG